MLARMAQSSVSRGSTPSSNGTEPNSTSALYLVAVESLLELGIEEAAATTLDWASAGRLAIGYNNGGLSELDPALIELKPTVFL